MYTSPIMAYPCSNTGSGGGEAILKPRRLKGHTAAVTCCVVSLARPSIIASSGEDGSICWFDLRCKDVVFSIKAVENKAPVSSICFNSGNEDIIYASSGTRVLTFDIREAPSWKKLETYKYNNQEINQISFSSKSSFLAAADDSGDVKIIDTRKQCFYKTLRAVHTNPLRYVAVYSLFLGGLGQANSLQFSSYTWVQEINFIPNVVTGGLDSKLVMWDLSKGRSYSILEYGVPNMGNHYACADPGQPFNPPFVHCIAVPEAKLSFGLEKVCAVARGDGVVDIMDLESEVVTSSAKSTSTLKLRKGSQSKSKDLEIPERNNDSHMPCPRKRLQLDYTYGGHRAAVSCVAFSLFGEKGKFVISGGNDSYIKMWNWPNLLDTDSGSCDHCAYLSFNTRRKVNWLSTAPKDSENLIVCDTSKIVKVYSLL